MSIRGISLQSTIIFSQQFNVKLNIKLCNYVKYRNLALHFKKN